MGAIFSSEIAGVLANALGFAAAFLALAAIGLISLALAACTPETQVGRTRSKDATRAFGAPGIATRSKDAIRGS